MADARFCGQARLSNAYPRQTYVQEGCPTKRIGRARADVAKLRNGNRQRGLLGGKHDASLLAIKAPDRPGHLEHLAEWAGGCLHEHRLERSKYQRLGFQDGLGGARQRQDRRQNQHRRQNTHFHDPPNRRDHNSRSLKKVSRRAEIILQCGSAFLCCRIHQRRSRGRVGQYLLTGPPQPKR